MPGEEHQGSVPVWDGKASSWLLYQEDVKWFVAGLQKEKRQYSVGRLVARLGSVAKGLVRKWDPTVFEYEDGWLLFLRRLSESHLVRMPLPDADMHLTRW